MVAVFYPDVGPEWLGHQGDAFDAQADMMMAALGAINKSSSPNPAMNRVVREMA